MSSPVLTSCGQDEFNFGRSTPLSFLELQKSLLVSFQGCWTQWQRFESSRLTISDRYSTEFSQNTCFSWENGCPIPRPPEIPTSKFSGVLNTMAKWSRWVQIWQIYPQYWHLVVKMRTDDPFILELLTSVVQDSTGNFMVSRWVQIWQIYP